MINHILPSNLEVLMNMPGNTVMSTEEKKEKANTLKALLSLSIEASK